MGQVLSLDRMAILNIEQAVPDDLEGITLQMATIFGEDIPLQRLARHLADTPGAITLYVSLNMTAYNLLMMEVNCKLPVSNIHPFKRRSAPPDPHPPVTVVYVKQETAHSPSEDRADVGPLGEVNLTVLQGETGLCPPE